MNSQWILVFGVPGLCVFFQIKTQSKRISVYLKKSDNDRWNHTVSAQSEPLWTSLNQSGPVQSSRVDPWSTNQAGPPPRNKVLWSSPLCFWLRNLKVCSVAFGGRRACAAERQKKKKHRSADRSSGVMLLLTGYSYNHLIHCTNIYVYKKITGSLFSPPQSVQWNKDLNKRKVWLIFIINSLQKVKKRIFWLF